MKWTLGMFSDTRLPSVATVGLYQLGALITPHGI